jgi:hypothetical protein
MRGKEMMKAYHLLTEMQQQYFMFRHDAKIKETLKCATLWITSRSTKQQHSYSRLLEDSFLRIPVPTKRLHANNTVSI